MLRVLATLTLLVFLNSACSEFNQSDYLPLGERYDVTIHRDIWGVPHIYAAAGAQSHSDSDFMAAPTDAVGEDAVDSQR